LEKADIRTLEEGEVVTYNLAEQRGKQSAVDIQKIQ
jgi:cold shock CspA family protein